MRIAVIAAIGLFATPALAAADDWTRIAQTDSGVIVYVDNGSLIRKGAIVQGVERWDHRGDEKAKHREVLIRASYDCDAWAYRIKSADFTDVDGEPPETMEWDEKVSTYQAATKGSMADSVLTHVCARAK